MHLWFDRPLTEQPQVAMVGTTAQWLFRQPWLKKGSPKDDEKGGHGVYHQVVISGRHDLDDAPKEVLVDAVCDELRAAFPLAFRSPQPAQLLRYRVVCDPNAVYSLSPEFQAQRPESKTPIAGLSLAGDYVQTGWPATMEGAVISGRLAAMACLEELGQRTNQAQSLVTQGLPRGRITRWCIRD